MNDINLQQPKNISFSRDIVHCHPYLQERWPKVVYLFREATGNDLTITCSWRSVEEQQRLYAMGRTGSGTIVTNIDGVTRLSNHNKYPARAVDVAVNGIGQNLKPVALWNKADFEPLSDICHKLGLVWGGDWKSFPDSPHVEVPEDVA